MNQRQKFHNLDICSHGGVFSISKNQRRLLKLDFSSNINPLGISNHVIKNISNNIKSLSSIYPDPKCIDLKKALLAYIKTEINENWITVGNGGTELIHNFVAALGLKKPIIIIPTFCEYELACQKNNIEINSINLSNDFKLNTDQIIENSKKSDAIFLCNPNNPTGLLSTKAIKKIIDNVEPSTLIFIDESFIEFVSNFKHESFLSVISQFKNLLILRSMTKSFGLAGLRLGYLIANPKITRKIQNYQISWNVNGLAQEAGILALQDTQHLKQANMIVRKERIMIFNEINKKLKNFVPFKSDANFYLIRIKKITSNQLRSILLNKYNILVRNCNTFRGMESKNMIRVAVKNKNENLVLLKALKEIDNHIL
ncbi:MAG: pyridoxal phosphate-dependent aminotransferase [Nitrososphaeraceae archaeon]